MQNIGNRFNQNNAIIRAFGKLNTKKKNEEHNPQLGGTSLFGQDSRLKSLQGSEITEIVKDFRHSATKHVNSWGALKYHLNTALKALFIVPGIVKLVKWLRGDDRTNRRLHAVENAAAAIFNVGSKLNTPEKFDSACRDGLVMFKFKNMKFAPQQISIKGNEIHLATLFTSKVILKFRDFKEFHDVLLPLLKKIVETSTRWSEEIEQELAAIEQDYYQKETSNEAMIKNEEMMVGRMAMLASSALLTDDGKTLQEIVSIFKSNAERAELNYNNLNQNFITNN